MKRYTICFQVTGGITVEEADSEDEAMEYFYSNAGQDLARKMLSMNEISVTEIYEEG